MATLIDASVIIHIERERGSLDRLTPRMNRSRSPLSPSPNCSLVFIARIQGHGGGSAKRSLKVIDDVPRVARPSSHEVATRTR